MELLGKKIGMTQVFDAKGNFVGVTVVELGPCTVLQKKTADGKDKYHAVQLGFGARKAQNVTKPIAGICQKANAEPVALIREVRHTAAPTWNVGDKITAGQFKAGEFVDVIGVTKGKGFQGVVRRHKFAGGPASHGQKGWFRRPGAIGERLFPGRVFRGQRMPGHMGHVQVTTQNLRVVQVREADNVVLIEGSVPGHRGAFVVVRHAKKKTAKAT
jgi:large subunit ribosomal protein L3